MRRFIESHFGFVLVLACVGGLVLPGLPQLPAVSVVFALAGLMFVSCYKLRDGGFSELRWRDILLFFVLRYGVLPVAMWFAAQALVPQYATGVFLLAVLPAGVASPAFAAIYGGAVAPAFAIVIITQLAAPFLIPAQFSWMGGVAVAPQPAALFMTMVWCIFLPILVYMGARHHKQSAHYMHARNKLFSVLLIAFIIAFAIAKQRDIILNSGPELLGALAVSLLCYLIFIAFGWWIFPRRTRAERVALSACSSFNNAALGVSLALMHFGPPVVLFMAVSEIGWALLPTMFRGWLRWVSSSPADVSR